MRQKSFLSLVLSLFLLYGCASFDSGQVDMNLVDFIPKEAALKVVKSKMYVDDDLRVNARGFGSPSCAKIQKPGSIKDITFAMYQTYTNGHRILWLSLDHPSNTMFCGSAIFIPMSDEQVAPFLTALKSLGANINQYKIIHHKVGCYNCTGAH